tara:strand:- start:4256 stop:4480 length:225 start_codon:yes stop_codon:yes gene_type:complete
MSKDFSMPSICQAPKCKQSKNKQWNANARLIAAAPELLEVLQEILDATAYDHGGPVSLYKKAEKIIAKAKGEKL